MRYHQLLKISPFFPAVLVLFHPERRGFFDDGLVGGLESYSEQSLVVVVPSYLVSGLLRRKKVEVISSIANGPGILLLG